MLIKPRKCGEHRAQARYYEIEDAEYKMVGFLDDSHSVTVEKRQEVHFTALDVQAF